MLTALRTKATSWVLKILFGLLIISFAIWGIGDVFRLGGGPQPVAKVGGVEISGEQFMSQFRRELSRLQALFGGGLDAQQARQIGLDRRVLDDLVGRTLFMVHADRIGVVVPDSVVVQRVHADPAFRNERGEYDPLRLELMLQQAQLSMPAYESLLRHEIARSEIIDAISGGIVAPRTMVDAVYAYRDEKRIAATMLVANDSVVDVPTPDDAAVEAWYNENPDRYQAPEYRGLTVLRLAPDDVLSEIKVSAEELKEAYDARRSEYSLPERREIEQIVFPDEAAAKAGAEKLAQGTPFADLSQEATGGPPIELGLLTREQMLPELAGTAFATPEGQVSAPVESPLGWHILRVRKVEPAHTRTLDEVREDLTKAVAHEKAVDALVSMANQLDDAIAGGATIEDAARDLNVPLRTVPPVDSAGKAPDGSTVADIPDQGQVLQLGFSTEEGQLSPLTETPESGYVMVRVDSVRPAATRPLAEVRQQVVADWQAAQRAKAASERAEALAERLRGGGDIAAIAAEAGLSVKTSQPFTREAGDTAADIGPTLAGRLFDAKPGEVVTAPTATGTVVARLQEIVPADPAARSAIEDVRSAVRRSLIGDVLAQFGAALRERIDVTVNQTALNSLF